MDSTPQFHDQSWAIRGFAGTIESLMRLDSSMLDNILKKLIGSKNDRELKRLWARVQAINALEPGIQALSDAELKAKTPSFKDLLANGATMEEILPEAFAVAREASRRVLRM